MWRVWGIGHRTLAALVAGLALGLPACEHPTAVLEEVEDPLPGPYGLLSTSRYITMDDGVRIAVDVHVPTGLEAGARVPAILELTRYWRSREDEVPYAIWRAVSRGFAYVVVDERGTGASFGSWTAPLTDRALEDGLRVIDWIIEQPWSNGRVGATGVSYPGMAAAQLAARGHPALRAIVPQSDMWDLYGDLIFPGGVFNEYFAETWSELASVLDRSQSVRWEGETYWQKPVDEDPSGALLAQALIDHEGNLSVFDALQQVAHRDDLLSNGLTLDEMSTNTRVVTSDASSGVAVYQWGSWLDGGSADGVIRRFMETGGAQIAVIGAWSHGLGMSASPYHPPQQTALPRYEYQWDEVLNFFDQVLRRGDPPADRVLRYTTLGTDEWKETSTWPVPGTSPRRLYFSSGGTLVDQASTAPDGGDSYVVDFTALSSGESRWRSPVTGEARYTNRRLADQELLVYETEPLAGDVEITGYPVAHLYVTSTHDDGAFFVYLEDVSPDGRVTYVTEGVLRAAHRKVGTDPASWSRPTPFHSHRVADDEPLVPGEVAELAFGLQPTSVLIRAGHRIRIAIAGHDASAFRRIPEAGTPEIVLLRNAEHASYVELPVIGAP